MSPHFPPDSAAGTHRARILAPHLEKFGWKPIVLTVDPAGIEGELDPELATAVPRNMEVHRVMPWSHDITRRTGFGDLGLRAYRALKAAALDLTHSRRVDATLVTTYPTYPAMIATTLKRRRALPFVLDLQDPWVGAWGQSVGPGGAPDLRSRASRALAVGLERRVASHADALMSVTSRTMSELVARVPAAAPVPQLEVPIGWEPADWQRARTDGRRNVLFDPRDGCIHICAVGTLLPTALDTARAFLEGVAHVVRTRSQHRLRVWFVGTSNQRQLDAPAIVQPLAQAAGVAEHVHEHPARLAYFDALRVLRDASAVLVLGSNEPHYTPSRVFPAIASRRPVIARLHGESSAWAMLATAAVTRPVRLIRASDDYQGEVEAFAAAIDETLRASTSEPPADDSVLQPFTGESLARQVAGFLDRVCA